VLSPFYVKIILLTSFNYIMKKSILILSLLGCISSANADYSIKIPLEHNLEFYNWDVYSPLKSNWSNTGSVYGCSNWNPLESTITINQSYTQTATDCKQDQIRSVQNREIDKVSGRIKNVGDPYSESQVITVSDQKNSIGTKETWAITTPTYTNWTDDGSVINCSNWSPAPSTVTYGESFTQTTTDCEQPQIRSKQDREQETTTNTIRNTGTPIIERQNINASSSRNAIGTKENWVATTPSYTAWTNSGGVFSCSAWTPSTNSVKKGNGFTQYATCVQTQIRTKQNREQDSTTGAIRDSGAAQTESQNVSVGSSRAATGTYFCDRVCQGWG
jgi:hypothetical protein